MNALDLSKHYTVMIKSLKGSKICGWWSGFIVWPKIKLIQAFMVGLVTCNNEEDPFKSEDARVVTTDISL